MEQEMLSRCCSKQEAPLFSYLTHQLWPVFISLHQKSRNNEFSLSGSLVIGCMDAWINPDLLEVPREWKFTIWGKLLFAYNVSNHIMLPKNTGTGNRTAVIWSFLPGSSGCSVWREGSGFQSAQVSTAGQTQVFEWFLPMEEGCWSSPAQRSKLLLL